MRVFIKRNSDIILAAVFIVGAILGVAYSAFPQGTVVQRRCPGANPNPANASVTITKVGAIVFTACSGKTVTQQVTSFGSGTAAAPSILFSTDTDTGLFLSAANAIGFSTGGTERGTLSATGLFTTTGGVSTTTGAFSGVVSGANGTGAAPSFTFTSDPDTGVFRSGANTLGFATSGVEQANISSAGLLTTFGGVTTTIVTTSGAVELGNASDTSLTRTGAGAIAVEGVAVPTISSTSTLTNKRITSRIGTTASSATPTPDADANDQYNVTAQAAAAAFAAPTGTPTDGQRLIIRIKDNGTARALSFNAIYRFSTDLAAPTTTIISKTFYLAFIWNAADSKWDNVSQLNNF